MKEERRKEIGGTEHILENSRLEIPSHLKSICDYVLTKDRLSRAQG